MKTTIAVLFVTISLICSPAAYAGQITRTQSDGREVVTLVDHGNARSRSGPRVHQVRAAHARVYAKAVEYNYEPPAVAAAGSVDEMAAGVVRSMLAVRLLSSDSADLPEIGIDPTTSELRVLGAVADAGARDTVAIQAMNLAGTDAVRNEIRLLDYAPRVELVYNDAHVAERVERAILAWPELRAADIRIDVDQGITTLTGAVPTVDQRILASVAAASAPGVYLVQNRLDLQPD